MAHQKTPPGTRRDMIPQPEAATFAWSTRGRRWTVAVSVAGVWAALLACLLIFDAAVWLLLLVALFTLPALYDLIADPRAGFEIDQSSMRWFSGRRTVSLPLAEIDHLRLDTRLDFSVRATAVLGTGRKIRLPFECTPPHHLLEAEVHARGIPVQRHHFLPIG